MPIRVSFLPRHVGCARLWFMLTPQCVSRPGEDHMRVYVLGGGRYENEVHDSRRRVQLAKTAGGGPLPCGNGFGCGFKVQQNGPHGESAGYSLRR